MNEQDLDSVYERLANILSEQAKSGLEVHEHMIGSKATVRKPEMHLYGKREVSIKKRAAQKTYVAGIILQKNFVGLYLMPMYSHPKEIMPEHPELIRAKKGKSCLNITMIDPKIVADLKRMLRAGISRYRKEAWI